MEKNHNGGMAERLNAAVLKTVEDKTSIGSNPISSANIKWAWLGFDKH